MAGDPKWSPLAPVLGRILDGRRDLDLDGELDDPDRQIVAETVRLDLGLE